jgi:phosphoribosylformylglycinamidine (FGAM) synthase PurS component
LGETLLWIKVRNTSTALTSSELKLVGYNEINNGWVQSYHNFRIEAPRLLVNKKVSSELFKLFPNPVIEDVLHIELLDAANSIATIQITDILGKVIFNQTIERTNTPNQIVKIPTNAWVNGQYNLLYQSKGSDGKLYQISKPFTVR